MSRRGEKNARTLALTGRGAVQLALGAALLAAGLVGGWHAPAAGGMALLAGCLTGLAEVLLARRAGACGRAARLVEASERTESWVRVDQRGEVLENLARPDGRRGLYRQQSVRLTWTDALGFWRATRVEATGRELRVPPAVSPELLRRAADRPLARLVDASPEPDMASVRPYERGDGIRQISWRQSAHHGELMSFEGSGREAPPVLVVADTLGAEDGDALAATTAALLRGLERMPDVLLTDGVRALRTPVQQERFCAAVTGERADGREAAQRASEVARLAEGGSARRRVVLVTCDPDGALARALSRGPLGRSVTVVHAEGDAAAGPAREGAAEKDGAAPTAPAGPTGRARPRAAGELLALLACCALAAIATVPFGSIFYEGAWQDCVPALLVAGAAAGSLLGAHLRARGAGRDVRVALTGLLVAAILAVGVVVALGILDGRHGPLARGGPEAPTAFEDPLAALRLIVETGADQLGGAASSAADETWDLLVILMGAGLAALLAALASSRALRGAVALVPLLLSAADQSVMGPAARTGWVGAAVALGLLLVWLSVTVRPRLVLGVAVALLAAALGWASGALAPSGSFTAWSASNSGGTRVNPLVELSRDLRNRSSARVLTYETTADRPLYLRLSVLDSFDGETWSFGGDAGTELEDGSPLYWAGVRSDPPTAAPLVTTEVRLEEGAATDGPVPPGTAVVSGDESAYETTGCYVAPITTVRGLAALDGLARDLGRNDTATAAPDERMLWAPAQLPPEVAEVVSQLPFSRGDAAPQTLSDQVEAVRWLVGFFTDGSFSYSLDAPGGDEGNLDAIGSFLEARSGYCTHYATAFALLAREAGVPARVALGFSPGDATDANRDRVVTMRQLHAWAEVWLDGIGWVGVDVTPSAGGGATPTPDSEPEEPADTPDAPDQTPTQPEEEPAENEPAEKNDEVETSSMPWLTPALLALALVAAGGGAAVLLARRQRVTTWRAAWTRVCRAARHAGVRWDASATEDQVAGLICERLHDEALAAEVRRIARNACQERYGEKPVPFTPPPLREITRALRKRTE